MILVIDNYDSFTYNLVQYLGELGAEVEVFRNDAIDIAGIERREPEGVLISPGPGTPDDAGITLEVVRKLGGKLPRFGVCLGHQAIGQAFGGEVVRFAIEGVQFHPESFLTEHGHTILQNFLNLLPDKGRRRQAA